ncbi:MAG TPA: efflux RND transporter permease subunit, partial [Gemmatimonadales bacterium]|nr:efflux RND transporter permease subunit [Gemmatimonadales bacterium]
RVGGQFMPLSDEEQTAVTFETPVGASIAYTRARAEDIDSYIRNRPEVAWTYLAIGGDAQQNINRGYIYVKLREKHERDLTQQQFESELRARFATLEGASATVSPPSMGGGMLPLQINIQGPDLARLQSLSERVLELTRQVPGAVELQSSLEDRKPEFVVDLDRELAANLGLSVGQVATTLRTVLSGAEAGTFEDSSGVEHDIVVRVAPEFRASATDIARVPIATANADQATQSPAMVRLGQVARIRMDSAPGEIKRLGLERMVRVEGNYQGRPLTEVTADIQARIADVELPAGYRMSFGGEATDFAETVGYIIESLVLAVVFIYLILASQFGSFLQPLAIMFSLPLSIIGVVAALLLTADTFNIMSMIGLIMLMGLVSKNAILLIDFVNQARARGEGRREALIDAGELRLRPIVMTTLAMIFGMLPTALGVGDGGEFRAPMARAVIGGLITSTLLTLVVVPVVYTYFDDFGSRVTAWFRQPEIEAEEERRRTGEHPVPAGAPQPGVVPAD